MSPSSLGKAISDCRPVKGITSGPAVTIVTVNCGDTHHLHRLLAGLRDRTLYKDFDVVVVNSGSSPDSVEAREAEWPFEVTVAHDTGHRTVASANNKGISAATGEYVLFLSSDNEPINPSWLGVLVDSLERDPELVAAGALLINHPDRLLGRFLTSRHDVSVQSAGILVDWSSDGIQAKDLDSGTDPLGPDRSATRRRPGTTSSCLLVKRVTLHEVGGLSSANDSADWDLDVCLRLHEHGDIVVVGAAALFHHGHDNHQNSESLITDIKHSDYRQRFVERWGPRLNRDLRRDFVRHRHFWNQRNARIGIAHRSAPESDRARLLAEALDRRGWEVTLLPLPIEDDTIDVKELDVIITTSPTVNWSHLSIHSLRVAWIQDGVGEWTDSGELDRYLLFLLSDPIEAKYVEELTGLAPVIFLPARDFSRNDNSLLRESPWATDVLVVGNRHGSDPRLSHILEMAPEERLVIAGAGWRDDPRLTRYWRSPIDDDHLDSLMTDAGVVIHAANAPTGCSQGEAILRTLAAGGLPVSSSFELSQWLFDGELPVITTRGDFRRIVETYVYDSAARNRKAAGLHATATVGHTYDARAATLDEALDSALSRPMVAMKISPPNRQLARQGGDMHFARQFGRALRRLGLHTRVDILPEWDQPGAQDADIVVHLRGLDVYTPKPGAVNVLWIVSHPADITPAECERYDLVLVASNSFAEQLQDTVNVPVLPLLQAADPFVFHPVESDPRLHTETLFVGNARWPPRTAPRWAMELGLPLTIYGARWENFPEHRYVADTYFPNEQLNTLYASADIVLNDHWADMKAHGFISNRLFDVLSAGGFVLSDHVEGIPKVFDGAIPTYRSKKELAELVERFRDDPLGRAKHAIHGMQYVHREHTFDARAQAFVRFIDGVARSIPLDVAGNTRADLSVLAVGGEEYDPTPVD